MTTTILVLVPAAIVLLVAPPMVIAWLIHRAQERGDHSGSIRVLDRFGWLLVKPMRDDFRAMLLVYSGEPEQQPVLYPSGRLTGHDQRGSTPNPLGVSLACPDRVTSARGVRSSPPYRQPKPTTALPHSSRKNF
jgi:hypothetical protein